MNYEECMDYLEEINNNNGMIFGLFPMKNMLKYIGNPEKKLRIIHIAGTNGKGSTGAFLSSILSEAGYKVGRYVSPSVDGYRERIQYEKNGIKTYISEEEVARYLTRIKETNEILMPENERSLTTFEMETVMSVMAFSDWNCDYVILECGLGGKDDATNAIDNKELCIFTSISKDHMKILGNSVEEIAYNKAGILRKNVKAVSAVMSEEVMKVLNKVAKEYSTIVERCEHIGNCVFTMDGTDFQLNGVDSKISGTGFHINMPGVYQPENAALAIKAALVLFEMNSYNNTDNNNDNTLERRFPYPYIDIIRNGLKKAVWPKRFQVVRSNPYVIIDGAHNVDGIRKLKESIILLCTTKKDSLSDNKPIGIMGVFADKEVEAMLWEIKGLFVEIHTVTAPSPRAMEANVLAGLIDEICDTNAVSHDNMTAMEVCDMLIENGNNNDIVIFGSLSLT
ncbi:MAG: bifunctional folylpolyglutamate synthase/dihydrofolate synthase [Lachnospiraceae bacterium]|nr:bifunctional folylpolyglutamate synthase/dihydrofolate synthase [Lachnospiraceae bacterium]